MLPVKPKIGGKGGHGLSLKTDMTNLGNVKVNHPKAKVVGSLKKHPGRKHAGK